MTLGYSTSRAQKQAWWNSPENKAVVVYTGPSRGEGRHNHESHVPSSSSNIPDDVKDAIVKLDHGLGTIMQLRTKIVNPRLKVSDDDLKKMSETLINTWQEWTLAIEGSNDIESTDAEKKPSFDVRNLIDLRTRLDRVNALIELQDQKTNAGALSREDYAEMIKLKEEKSRLEMQLQEAIKRQMQSSKGSPPSSGMPASESPTMMLAADIRSWVFHELENHEGRKLLYAIRLKNVVRVSSSAAANFSPDESETNGMSARLLERLNGVIEIASNRIHGLMPEMTRADQSIVQDLEHVVSEISGEQGHSEEALQQMNAHAEKLVRELKVVEEVSNNTLEILQDQTDAILGDLNKTSSNPQFGSVLDGAQLSVRLKLADFRIQHGYFIQSCLKIDEFIQSCSKPDENPDLTALVKQGEVSFKGLFLNARDVWRSGKDVYEELQAVAATKPTHLRPDFRISSEGYVRSEIESMNRQLKHYFSLNRNVFQNAPPPLSEVFAASNFSKLLEKYMPDLQTLEENFQRTFQSKVGIVSRLRSLLSHPPLYKAWVRESLAEICTGTCTL